MVTKVGNGEGTNKTSFRVCSIVEINKVIHRDLLFLRILCIGVTTITWSLIVVTKL